MSVSGQRLEEAQAKIERVFIPWFITKNNQGQVYCISPSVARSGFHYRNTPPKHFG
jgi:PHD/YefM family antitoxin component YafN of YafNO toxin-antitoxin module